MNQIGIEVRLVSSSLRQTHEVREGHQGREAHETVVVQDHEGLHHGVQLEVASWHDV
jgi:hypothetical protein